MARLLDAMNVFAGNSPALRIYAGADLVAEMQENLFTNPAFETLTGATVEVRRNQVTNPSAAGGGSGPGGFTAAGPASVASVSISDLPNWATAAEWTVAATNDRVYFTQSSAGEVRFFGGVWVKAPSGAQYRVSILAADGDGQTTHSTVDQTGTGAWQWVSGASATPNAGEGGFRFEVRHIGGTLGTYRATGWTVEKRPVAGAFSSTYSYDPDLTPALSGSNAVLTGKVVKGVTVSNCLAIRSSRHGGSLRLIATGSSAISYAEISPRTPPSGASVQRTALATLHLDAPVGSSTWARSIRTISPDAYSTPAPNVAGSHEVRHVFDWDSSSGSGRLLLFHGGNYLEPDVYWSSLAIVAGDYNGGHFDGENNPGQQDASLGSATSFWTGAPHDSTSKWWRKP